MSNTGVHCCACEGVYGDGNMTPFRADADRILRLHYCTPDEVERGTSQDGTIVHLPYEALVSEIESALARVAAAAAEEAIKKKFVIVNGAGQNLKISWEDAGPFLRIRVHDEAKARSLEEATTNSQENSSTVVVGNPCPGLKGCGCRECREEK